MISEERIKDLWLYRDNIHDGNLVAQLCDLVRAIEAEVTVPLKAMIKQLEQENAERQRDEYKADAADEISRLKAAYDQAERTIQEQGRAIDRLITERDKSCQIFKATIAQQAERIKQLEQVNSSKLDEVERKWGTANRLIERAREQIVWMLGDHIAPNDCYSTGPLTGTPIDNLCPSCYAHTILAAIERHQKGESPE